MRSSFKLFAVGALGAVFLSLGSPRAARAEAPEAAPGSGASATPSADDNAEARRLYRKGAEAFDAGRPQEARSFLLQAWAIRQTYDVATALGQVELDLGLPREAAEHLDFALRTFPPQLSAETLQRVRGLFFQAEKKVGTLIVRAERPGTRIFLDAKPVGVTPLSGPLFLEPGSHSVDGEEGSDHVTRTLEIEAGTTQSVGLEFAAPRPAAPEVRIESKGSVPPVPLLVGGALVVAGVGVGIWFAVDAGNRSDEARALRESLGNRSCSGPASSSECTELRDIASRYSRDRNVSTAGFVGAGVAAVATGAFWLLSSRATTTAERRNALRVNGSVDNHSAALWATGEF
jgi:hypothetical protein